MPYNTNFTWDETQLLKKCKDSYIMVARPRPFNFAVPSVNGNSIRMYFELVSNEPDPIAKCESLEFINAPYIAFDSYQDAKCLPEMYDFDSDDIEYKKQQCEEFYKDKLVIFTPVYRINNDGQSYKNMQMVDLVDDMDCSSFRSVPKIDLDNKRFESILNNQEFIEIDCFDNELIDRIDFVICGDYIYRFKHNVGYKPFLIGSDMRDKAWKYNGKKEDDNIAKIKISDIDDFYEYSIEGSDSIVFIEDDLAQRIEFLDISVLAEETIAESEDINDIGELDTKEHQDDYIDELSEDEETKATNASEVVFINGLASFTKANNLIYDFNDLVNFHTSVKTNPLTIISGMSGTGKTQLAYNYARMLDLSEDNNTLLFIPISPSYAEPSDILGYLNPMTNEYVPSETGLVDFLKHADIHKDKMHMVIFDEMNLSQVEYWFSPFISILEKDMGERFIKLYDPAISEMKDNENKQKYPSRIKINENVIFVGTVNIDETTKDFSDRLLDRTFVLNLKKVDFQTVYNDLKDNELNKKEYQDSKNGDASVFLNWNKKYNRNYLSAFDNHEEERAFLDELSNLLSSSMHNDGISHRVTRNIGYYLLNIPEGENGPIIDRKEAFDMIINQTVMQKIRGTQAQLASLIGIDGDDAHSPEKSSLIALLDKYSAVSNFENVRKAIDKKAEDLHVNGYTN